MNDPLPPDDSLDKVILRYLAERDAEPNDDPVFDGIDPAQPLSAVAVTSEDTDRIHRMIFDSLTGPDNCGTQDKTLRP